MKIIKVSNYYEDYRFVAHEENNRDELIEENDPQRCRQCDNEVQVDYQHRPPWIKCLHCHDSYEYIK